MKRIELKNVNRVEFMVRVDSYNTKGEVLRWYYDKAGHRGLIVVESETI
jgi:hypothetical protein